MRRLPFHPAGAAGDPASAETGIAKSVRAASRDVYAGWTEPDGGGNAGEVSQRAIEAQVAAAVTGRKPLYFEPWGEGLSEAFAEAYRQVIPPEVRVLARDGMLFVFRPEVVEAILDSDPAFYRKAGESPEDSIVRVSLSSMNGELLGYGARHILERPAHHVRIYKDNLLLLYFFVSSPDRALAERIANERTGDFYRAHGWTGLDFVMEYVE